MKEHTATKAAINRRTPKIATLCALLVVTALAVPGQDAGAAALMLPSGEPDPNCPELRLWVRADSGIKDTQGRGPADPNFNGMVAAWADRSPQKFDLAAAPGKAPLLVERQPAAGNRPTVAFNGQQVLTRSNATLNDRPTSTVVLVVQGRSGVQGRNGIYSAGKGQNTREWLGLVFGNDVLAGVNGGFLTTGGERGYGLELALPSDGRGESRFAAIISNGEVDRRSLEFHDGLGDPVGGDVAITLLAPQQPASDKCSRDFYLGGAEEDLFWGQIAEMMVFNRGLSPAERRDMLNYLRRRYELDMTEALFPPGNFLLQAEDFEGNWTCPAAAPGQYLGKRHVTAEGKPADEGIKTTINLPRDGTYHVWVRALESGWQKDDGRLRTIVQGKELAVTHTRAPNARVIWREAGEVPLKAGPAEIVVRGEGPGPKDCDAVLISPTAATPDAVEGICALAQRIRRVGGKSRLTAVFENGLRLDGSLLTGWRWMGPSGQISRPDPAAMPALVCLQFDRRQAESERQPAVSSEAVLEFQNGDRLQGTVCGYVPATTKETQEAPAQLLIRPPVGFLQDPAKQTVAVEIDWLRRIVFEPSPRDRRCPPKTLICRDGRVYSFRAIRWNAESVSVLTDESLEQIRLGDVAEVRMAADDAWNMYYRELSILDPEGTTEIVRVETTEGISLTASTIRSSQFRGEAEAIASVRLLRPVWSRAPIPVRWTSTRLLWRAPAHVVPLSRFSPEQVAQRGVLGSSWKWQADRNVAGGILRSDGLDYLWGFGVHAPNEMVFLLPDCVRAFRASAGMDAAVGHTGCAIAKVYANHSSGAPLYQSKPLVGSGMPVSTGEIALPAAAGAARRLVLVTENADALRPAGGDPLDIGNHVDWLEPILLLDPAKLHAEVAKQGPAAPK